MRPSGDYFLAPALIYAYISETFIFSGNFFPTVFLWLRVEFIWLFKNFQQEALRPFLSSGLVKIKKLFPKVKEEFLASWHFLYPSSGFNRKIVFATEILRKYWSPYWGMKLSAFQWNFDLTSNQFVSFWHTLVKG